MSIIDFLIKDWRHIAVGGLVCFIGGALIAEIVGISEERSQINREYEALSETLETHKISIDDALSNISLFSINRNHRLRHISHLSQLDLGEVKDIYYAIWLSGFHCEYITIIESISLSANRNSIVRQMDDPEVATVIGIAGTRLGAWDKAKLESAIERGDEAAARRMLFDHIAPLIDAGIRDVSRMESGGTVVRCGAARYRIAPTLGSSGILTAARM